MQTQPLAHSVQVSLVFHLPTTRRLDRPPDLDKLVRAVLDALTGIVWVDDAQVQHLVAAKHHASPAHPVGVTILVFDFDV